MKKFNRKAGLYFGIFLILVSMGQGLLGAKEISAQVIQKSLMTSVISGTIGGLIYGFMMGFFASSKQNSNDLEEKDDNGHGKN
jgi:hypothetical protein